MVCRLIPVDGPAGAARGGFTVGLGRVGLGIEEGTGAEAFVVGRLDGSPVAVAGRFGGGLGGMMSKVKASSRVYARFQTFLNGLRQQISAISDRRRDGDGPS